MTLPPMTSPMLALRAAIVSPCSGDAELASLLGGTVRLDAPFQADEPARVGIALTETTARRDRATNLVRVTLALRATTEVVA